MSGTMLELWRPPRGAGEALGCVATTYTFDPGLFDEQCLSRFLEIESDPAREDLAYALQRESRLGAAYACVLVDQRQSGVEHSLRWDVLPVRIAGGKQHAKISVLAWAHHVRVIVASANLTVPGYRRNYEVAGALDFSAEECDGALLGSALGFLRQLLAFVPGGREGPGVGRCSRFLDDVAKLAASWTKRSRDITRQSLAFTLPSRNGSGGSSALDAALEACRRRGTSPDEMLVASPFFDQDQHECRVMAEACKRMARGVRRDISIYMPREGGDEPSGVPRLAAPRSVFATAARLADRVSIYALPSKDGNGNPRVWHAKMLALRGDKYSALMVGSSNFTCAGMGVGGARNAEANIVTIVDRVAHARKVGDIAKVWPEGTFIKDPEGAEWIASKAEEEEAEGSGVAVPSGFLSATYRASEPRAIILALDTGGLPPSWSISACSQPPVEILESEDWKSAGSRTTVSVPWGSALPPARLLVEWDGNSGYIPINVENSSDLPPPPGMEGMSADELLLILAASDPGAAFRAWARTRQESDGDLDPELDVAVVDVDPLRAYDLQSTFLHKIRRRARVLAQLRENLERPASTVSALEWRLTGCIGIGMLAHKLADAVVDGPSLEEDLLALADLLVVISETRYRAAEGALSADTFARIFRGFLADLSRELEAKVAPALPTVSPGILGFWNRVLKECKK